RVIAPLDLEEARGGPRAGLHESRDERSDLLARAEDIARPLNKQHRRLHLRQVSVPSLIGFSGWMQGVAEEHAPDRVDRPLRSTLRRDSPPHRLPPGKKWLLRARS